ncbi:MAG: hypothetical protein JO027_18930 [Solirubrobacterales bacterium]|nr:hypothetical protein [Solirubrobacterales bacterium]
MRDRTPARPASKGLTGTLGGSVGPGMKGLAGGSRYLLAGERLDAARATMMELLQIERGAGGHPVSLSLGGLVFKRAPYVDF